MRKHVLALGKDPSIQRTLWQAFGNEVEVMYNDGHQPILNLVGNIPPDVILADLKLFREGDLGNQIKGDDRVAGVPLLLLADEGEMLPDDQLTNWGVAGIINQPVDAEELKLRMGNFLDSYHEINIDEFRLDDLDEELRHLNQVQESPAQAPQAPQVGNGGGYSNDDIYTKELDQILAEIDEVPTTDREEGAEMKAEEKPIAAEESIVAQESEVTPAAQESEVTSPEIEMEVTPSVHDTTPRPPSLPTNGSVEQWFRSIAEERIADVIAHENLSQIIEKVAQSVVPRVAENLVSKEIDRIKQKITGE